MAKSASSKRSLTPVLAEIVLDHLLGVMKFLSYLPVLVAAKEKGDDAKFLRAEPFAHPFRDDVGLEAVPAAYRMLPKVDLAMDHRAKALDQLRTGGVPEDDAAHARLHITVVDSR